MVGRDRRECCAVLSDLQNKITTDTKQTQQSADLIATLGWSTLDSILSDA